MSDGSGNPVTDKEESIEIQDKTDLAKSLFGIIPSEMTLEQAREERLDKI